MTDQLLISIDDTDMEGGEGTGRLARRIATSLDVEVEGVTRHQLFVHPSIKYTKRNSCNVIIARGGQDVRNFVRDIVLERHQSGSDPGLAISSRVPEAVQEFGRNAQRMVLTKQNAARVALDAGIYLEEIGGNGEGIIGALAGLGLCSTGEDGRYVMLPRMRELRGIVTTNELEGIGIRVVVLDSGVRITDGEVMMADKIRPSRISGRAVLFVKELEGRLYPVTL